MAIKIAILDSGVRANHPAFNKTRVEGFSLIVDKGKVYPPKGFIDQIGHGTAIFYLIMKQLKNAEITNIKIYDKNSPLTQETFQLLLTYI
ncbi:MAG: hypothetical protein HFJ79_04760 [Clostridiales bacterium]|nr:hypothetical protein [Clostridiales bacterium]